MASAMVRTLLICRASSFARASTSYVCHSSTLTRNRCAGRKEHGVRCSFTNFIVREFSRERRVKGPSIPVRAAVKRGVVAAVEEQLEDESEQEEEEEDVPEKPSRGQSKKQSAKARNWGRDLACLAPAQLRQAVKWASLDEEVYDAVMLVKNLGTSSRVRNGRRRQYNYIGGLLRNVDPELMESVLKATKDGDVEGLVFIPSNLSQEADDAINEETEEAAEEDDPSSQGAASWLQGLIEGVRAVEDEVYSVYDVDFDRQELRKLVREARRYLSVETTAASDDVEADSVDPDLAASQSKRQRAQKMLYQFLLKIVKERQANVY